MAKLMKAGIFLTILLSLFVFNATETNALPASSYLQVTVSGPSVVYYAGFHEWSANISGGVPPYKLSWQYPRADGQWYFMYHAIVLAGDLFGSCNIGVTVTDAAGTRVTASKYVTVRSSSIGGGTGGGFHIKDNLGGEL